MKKIIAFIFLSLFLGNISSTDFSFVAFVDYYGGIEPSQDYENLRSQIYMSPTFSGYNDSLGYEWVLSSRLWVQPIGEDQSIDPWDILDEAYLLFPKENFDITVGQKVVSYGFADIYGPLNALHSTNRSPYSLDDSYDSRRGDPLVQITFYPTFSDTLELTYVPFTRPDKESGDSVYISDTQETIEWSDSPFITENPHSIFFDYKHYGEKMDIQVFYGYYTENTPDFSFSEIDSSVATTVDLEYNKKQTIGFAYATRLGGSTLSQDIAFNITSDWDGTDLGAQNSDFTVNTQYLTNLPWGILSQTTLYYSYFINYGNHEDSTDVAASDLLAEEIQIFHTQPLEHIAFIVTHLEKSFLREKMKGQLNVGFFFSPQVYIAPRLAYSVTDYWALETGADITLGDPSDSILRRNPNDDNFYVRAVYRY